MEDKILVITDGGCRGNGKTDNVGGWAVILKYNDIQKEYKGAIRDTTNNRMELFACVQGLSHIKRFDIPIEVYTDSGYLCNCMAQHWYRKWQSNGWITSNKTPVENKDLWEELIKLKSQFKNIIFKKVKGHSGDEWNELADKLVNQAMNELN
jgi:ribonuclease HI